MYDQYIVGFMMIGGIGLGIRHGKHKILCDIKHCGYKRKKKNLCDILAPVMFFNRKYLIFENITISSDGYLKIWISCGSKEFGFFTELFYNLI